MSQISLKSVLLIEDDTDDQDFFKEALTDISSSLTCDVTRNGKEALERLNKTLMMPSFIFLDIKMPKMNGKECLSQLKKNFKTKDIPVVMLTTSIAQRENAFALGAKAYIVKPDNFQPLRKEIANALS